MTTLPDAAELEMWPYVGDDSMLWNLDYTERISDLWGEMTDDMEEHHAIALWLFDIFEATYVLAREFCDVEMLERLRRRGFRAPSIRSPLDLEENALEAYIHLYVVRTGHEPGEY